MPPINSRRDPRSLPRIQLEDGSIICIVPENRSCFIAKEASRYAQIALQIVSIVLENYYYSQADGTPIQGIFGYLRNVLPGKYTDPSSNQEA